MIMSRLYFAIFCATTGVLAIFGAHYVDARPRVEVTCEDPVLGKLTATLHPDNVIETPVGWVIRRPDGASTKTEVYKTCSRYWP